jgi:transcriptional regulator with XRE-family HTH domain
MTSFILISPQEMAKSIAERSQAKRLSLNLTQKSLSERSGVSLGVLKKFERTGKISLESLLKIALALGAFEEFKLLFSPTSRENLASLDDLFKDNKRQRGRK